MVDMRKIDRMSLINENAFPILKYYSSATRNDYIIYMYGIHLYVSSSLTPEYYQEISKHRILELINKYPNWQWELYDFEKVIHGSNNQ